MVQRAEWITSGVPLTKEEVYGRLPVMRWYHLVAIAVGLFLMGAILNLIEGKPFLELPGLLRVIAFVATYMLLSLLFPRFGKQAERAALAKKLDVGVAYSFDFSIKRDGIYLGGGPAVGWFEDGLFRIRSTTVGFDLAPQDIVKSPYNERQEWESPIYTLSEVHENVTVSLDTIRAAGENKSDRPVIDFTREFSSFMKGDPDSAALHPPVTPAPFVKRQARVALSQPQVHLMSRFTWPVIVISFVLLIALNELGRGWLWVKLIVLAVLVFAVGVEYGKSKIATKKKLNEWNKRD